MRLLKAPPLYFPSLALIFTASFSVYMPERLKEAKHLLPLPPWSSRVFHPASFLAFPSRGAGALPHAWGTPGSFWVSAVESVDFFATAKRWILTRTHLLTTLGLPFPKWRFGEGHPNKVDLRSLISPRKPDIFTFCPLSLLVSVSTVFWWSSCLYMSL